MTSKTPMKQILTFHHTSWQKKKYLSTSHNSRLTQWLNNKKIKIKLTNFKIDLSFTYFVLPISNLTNYHWVPCKTNNNQ